MALIYSSFSQINESILPGLVGEYTVLIDYFNSKKIKEKVDYKAGYGKSVNDLTSDVIQHQKDMRLFHFSGHSTKDSLEFPEDEFSKDHVSTFFNTLNSSGTSKLQCVFLNGCTNEAIVNRLVNVPVVIGSRSPILNDDAIKFTGDFFKALISGKKTYEESFNQAVSALPNGSGRSNIVRAIGAINSRPNESILNDYFMVINNEKVAKKGFPVRRSLRSKIMMWMMYLAALLTIGFGTWTFINQGKIKDIIDISDGFRCPEFIDNDKCNILIGNFNKGANKKISDVINENTTLEEYLEGTFAKTWTDLIPESDKKISWKKLPDTCGFEYLMTGFVSDDEKRISISLYPSDQIKVEREKYNIGSLFDLQDSILNINDVYQDQFIISKICVACASKNKNSIPLAEAQIENLEGKAGNEIAYQHLSEEMGGIHLEQKDTLSAINSMSRVASVDINDKALAAMEEKSNLEEEKKFYPEAYETQSKYLASIIDRQNSPSKYEMLEPNKKYELAKRSKMLSRANLVVEHQEELSMHNQQALKDFYALRKLNASSSIYEKEIKFLEGRIKDQEIEPEVEPIEAKFKIVDRLERPITRATTNYRGKVYKSDGDGIITIPCPNENCLRKDLTIKATLFLDETVTIRNVNKTSTVILPWEPRKVDEITIKVLDKNNNPIQNSFARFQTIKHIANRQGVITIPCEDESCLDKVVNVSADDYKEREIALAKKDGGMTVTLQALPTKINRLSILVRDENNKPIDRAFADYNSDRYDANTRGVITIPCENESCIDQVAIVMADGYNGAEVVLVKKQRGLIATLIADAPVNLIDLKGQLINHNKSPISGALITFANNVTESDSEGTIDLGSYGENDLPANSILIQANGYRSREVTVSDFRKNPTIQLNQGKPSDPTEQKYLVYGKVTDCNYNNTIIKKISLDGKAVKVNSNGNYQHFIYGFNGMSILVTVGGNYVFEKRTLKLGNTKKQNKDLKAIGTNQLKVTISGQILLKGNPMLGTNVLIKGTSQGTVTDFDGKFTIQTDSHYCKELVVSGQGFKSKTVELRNYSSKSGKMTVNIDLDK